MAGPNYLQQLNYWRKANKVLEDIGKSSDFWRSNVNPTCSLPMPWMYKRTDGLIPENFIARRRGYDAYITNKLEREFLNYDDEKAFRDAIYDKCVEEKTAAGLPKGKRAREKALEPCADLMYDAPLPEPPTNEELQADPLNYTDNMYKFVRDAANKLINGED